MHFGIRQLFSHCAADLKLLFLSVFNMKILFMNWPYSFLFLSYIFVGLTYHFHSVSVIYSIILQSPSLMTKHRSPRYCPFNYRYWILDRQQMQTDKKNYTSNGLSVESCLILTVSSKYLVTHCTTE